MSKTFKTALGGILAALSVALMMMTVIPVMTLSMPVFAGMLLTVFVIEGDKKAAVSVYAVSGVLSFLVISDKEAALYYIFLFGYYPILKAVIEGRIKKKPVRAVIKLAVFNGAVIAVYFIAKNVLKLPMDDMGDFGKYTPLILLGMGNAAFPLYDYCIYTVVILYIKKIRPKIAKYIK